MSCNLSAKKEKKKDKRPGKATLEIGTTGIVSGSWFGVGGSVNEKSCTAFPIKNRRTEGSCTANRRSNCETRRQLRVIFFHWFHLLCCSQQLHRKNRKNLCGERKSGNSRLPWEDFVQRVILKRVKFDWNLRRKERIQYLHCCKLVWLTAFW